MNIVWSDNYLKYSFGSGHPSGVDRALPFLEKVRNSAYFKIVEPPKASDDDILLAHTKDYLERVKELALEEGQLSIDTPLSPEILDGAYWYVGGTIFAFEQALSGEKVLNTLGGLHHAGKSDASGFCVFNDHAIAIKKFQNLNRIKKAAVFDVDVHAGNGTQEIFYDDPSVLKISLHQDPMTLYPGTGFAEQKGEGRGLGFNLNFPLPPSTKGKEYLKVVDSVLPKVFEFEPDITVLILGVDTYKSDPLAGFLLDKRDYQEIGKRFSPLEKLVILCAGGYSKEVPDLWWSFLEGYLGEKI